VPDQAAIAQMSEAERLGAFRQEHWGSGCGRGGWSHRQFLMAIVIFAGLAMVFGKPARLCVDIVRRGSAVLEAGFQPGDVVLSINGRRIDNLPRCSGL
jgi:regulator of sigma E protease